MILPMMFRLALIPKNQRNNIPGDLVAFFFSGFHPPMPNTYYMFMYTEWGSVNPLRPKCLFPTNQIQHCTFASVFTVRP